MGFLSSETAITPLNRSNLGLDGGLNQNLDGRDLFNQGCTLKS